MAKYILSDIFRGGFSITQLYGVNPDYYKQFGLPGHEGVDWGLPVGTPIVSPFDGFILRAVAGDKDYGNFVVVWDNKQLCAVWLCHLQDTTVQPGQSVKCGDLLGHSGNTGNTTGPHLHVNFVETDSHANRLNMDNGFQGFLNIMDQNLVAWNLTVSSFNANTPVPSQNGTVSFSIPAGDTADEYMVIRKSDFTAMHIKCDLYDPMVAGGYSSIKAIDDKVLKVTNDLQGKINTLEGQVKQLSDANTNLTTQNKSINDSASSMADLYKKKCEEDSAVADSLLTTGHTLDAKTQDIQTIGSALNTNPERNSILKAVSDLMDRAAAKQEVLPLPIKSNMTFWDFLGIHL